MSGLRRRLANNEQVSGWLFCAPALVGIGVFLLVPIGFALWISFREWSGFVPPGQSTYVGLDNYRALLVEPGFSRTDFALSLRNNLYYVIGVVPLQTMLAFGLAVVVNQRFLRGKSFFRTAYYFPSITSSIAVSLIFLFLFQNSGIINVLLRPLIGEPINWLANANGLIHNVLGVVGVETAPAILADNSIMGVSLWEWLAGPSVTLFGIMLLVTWTSTGTFMLIFLAGLQGIPTEVDEATMIDGASPWQRFRHVTVPMLKPTLFFVLTIGLISTWQVFDQIFVISAGGPQGTTVTPAFLLYREGFRSSSMGTATAIAFILLVIIMAFTLLQRWLIDPDEV